jgi:hypothetical protein
MLLENKHAVVHGPGGVLRRRSLAASLAMAHGCPWPVAPVSLLAVSFPEFSRPITRLVTGGSRVD